MRLLFKFACPLPLSLYYLCKVQLWLCSSLHSATSDNIEAISEAASSHSVGSDLDNENDNLSDMVSANVSGHGTPNVSGRDTPISQADSQVCQRVQNSLI